MADCIEVTEPVLLSTGALEVTVHPNGKLVIRTAAGQIDVLTTDYGHTRVDIEAFITQGRINLVGASRHRKLYDLIKKR